MDRQMSYELDGAFAQRNAGELQSVPVVKTRLQRAGVTSLAIPMAQRIGTARHNKPLFSRNVSRIAGPSTESMAVPISDAATDLADYDMGEINLPVIGTLNVTQILIGAVVGMIAMKTIGHFAKRR